MEKAFEAGAFFDDVCSDDELKHYEFTVTAENHPDRIELEDFFEAAQYLADLARKNSVGGMNED